MELVNARFGHACNSSSTHSILLMPPGHGATTNTDGHQFGWDYFTAADPETKTAWVLAGFTRALALTIGEPAAEALMLQEFGFASGDWDSEDWAYVDHQSQPTAVSKDSTPGQDTIDYIRAWIELVQNPDIVIVGGNDNSDQIHPLTDVGTGIYYETERRIAGGTMFRVDGDMLTTFNRTTGARLSMRFGPDDTPRSPMLADIKITDHCTMGCYFCYQGSTPNTDHADIDDIERVAEWLGERECFEVALGGGEPTQHPQFRRVVAAFKRAGMNVNVTSRNLSWWADKENRWEASACTAVAASVETAGAAKAWLSAWQPRDEDGRSDWPTLSFQVIDGLVPSAELQTIHDLATEAGARVTMLGYKTTGFGANVTPEHVGAWVGIWKNKRYQRGWAGISAIDTVIAGHLNQYDLDIADVSVIDSEGEWSTYFDCVGGVTRGPCSYQPQMMAPWDEAGPDMPQRVEGTAVEIVAIDGVKYRTVDNET